MPNSNVFVEFGWSKARGIPISHFWLEAPGGLEAISLCGILTNQKLEELTKSFEVCVVCLSLAPYPPDYNFKGER